MPVSDGAVVVPIIFRIDGDAEDNLLRGNPFRDRILGYGGDDTLRGYGGDDTLLGGAGNDLLGSGQGDDLLRGGRGDDTLVGGLGHDTLYGGAGHDVFRFDDRDTGEVTAGPAADEIRDFSARDTIDLRAVDVLFFDGGGFNDPYRGGFSIWEMNGDSYVTWNTFNGLHEIKLTGYSSADLLDQIVWYDDDFGSSARTASDLPASGTVTGNIEVTQDTDWFNVTLEADRLYTFDLRGAPSDGGTAADTWAELVDRNGESVAFDDDGGRGLDARMTFLAEESGVYQILAGAFAPGSYTLEVTSEAYVDDVGDDAEHATALAAGEEFSGTLGVPSDFDWFAVTLDEGETYAFDLRGADSGSGTLSDPYLELYDADGNYVASNDDGETLDSHLVFEATTGGAYYIVAQGLGGTGTYQLSYDTSDETPPESALESALPVDSLVIA